MITINDRGILALAAIGLVSLYVIRRNMIALAKHADTALNPMSHENVAYTGVSGIADNLANDGQSLPLGIRIYNYFHPNE